MKKLCVALVLAVVGLGACSGNDGVSQLVSVAPEAAGANCPDGGSAIQTGADDNGDGVLDADEIQATSYLCNPAVVLATEVEDAGDNCEHGGTAIHSGTDDNGNGTLDAGEVDETVYACNTIGGVLEGNAVVDSALDVAVLNNYTEVTGHLYILASMDVTALPNLRTVGRDIYVWEPARGAISLPALETIGTGLFVESMYVESFSAPLVNVTTGDVTFDDGDNLTAVDISALHTVTNGYFTVANMAKLETFAAPALTTAGDFNVRDNALLESFSAPLMATADDVYVHGNLFLSSLVLPALETVTTNLEITDNPSLSCTEAMAIETNLSSLGGVATISGNDGC